MVSYLLENVQNEYIEPITKLSSDFLKRLFRNLSNSEISWETVRFIAQTNNILFDNNYLVVTDKDMFITPEESIENLANKEISGNPVYKFTDRKRTPLNDKIKLISGKEVQELTVTDYFSFILKEYNRQNVLVSDKEVLLIDGEVEVRIISSKSAIYPLLIKIWNKNRNTTNTRQLTSDQFMVLSTKYKNTGTITVDKEQHSYTSVCSICNLSYDSKVHNLICKVLLENSQPK